MNAKVITIGVAIILSASLWWAIRGKNETTLQKAGVHQSASGNVLAEFEAALQDTEQLLRKGDHTAAALKMYHAFPAFESHLQEKGFQEIEPGLTLNAWFEKKKVPLLAAMNDVFPVLIEKLKSGDLSTRSVESFLNQMPFAFANELKRNYQQQRPEIAKERAARASNWFFISVNAVSGGAGGGESYERIVTNALSKKWDSGSGLKLVFDSPGDWAEKQAAAKILAVKIEESFADYVFEGKDKNRGTGRAAVKAVVSFKDQTARKDARRSNWEALAPIVITNEAPEKIRFKFENERQTADFGDVEQAQRAALEKKMTEAAQKIPPFEFTRPQ